MRPVRAFRTPCPRTGTDRGRSKGRGSAFGRAARGTDSAGPRPAPVRRTSWRAPRGATAPTRAVRWSTRAHALAAVFIVRLEHQAGAIGHDEVRQVDHTSGVGRVALADLSRPRGVAGDRRAPSPRA